MQPRTKKLLALPVAGIAAALVWAGTASSAPPHPVSGGFAADGSASIVTVSCDAPGDPTGTVTTPLSVNINAENVVGPGDGTVPPAQRNDVTGYLASNGTPVALNGPTTLIPAGTNFACPGALPSSVPQSIFISAVGNAGPNSPATLSFTLEFVLAASGA
jgi:hypothetical protein